MLIRINIWASNLKSTSNLGIEDAFKLITKEKAKKKANTVTSEKKTQIADA